MRQQGFTFIGLLIYSALITAILSVTIYTMYQIIDTSDRAGEAKELTDNQRFVLQKVAWALKNVSAINTPSAGSSGTTLSVNKLNYAYNPLVISLNSGVLEITSGATTAPLTTSGITVSSTTFSHKVFSSIDVIEVGVVLEGANNSSTTLQTTFFVE